MTEDEKMQVAVFRFGAIATLNRWIFENRIISEYYSHLTLIKSNQK